jgi:hypothetical protein
MVNDPKALSLFAYMENTNSICLAHQLAWKHESALDAKPQKSWRGRCLAQSSNRFISS